MKINDEGLKLIKSFEGCRLKAYRDAVGVWTIGWGHTAGVKEGQYITQAQADLLLLSDLAKFEDAVERLGMNFNENEFSALVSFAYNCGVGNLNKLCKGRTKPEIASKMLLYDKAGGKVLAGLTRRRKAENELYNTPVTSAPKEDAQIVYQPPTITLKYGSVGSGVKWLQQKLKEKGYDIAVDGVFGQNTEKAVKDFQRKTFVDGIVGETTRKELSR